MKILDTIGNTPLVEVAKVNKSNLYAKLEFFNPGGSVKDRTAYYMIKDAIASNVIDQDTVLIEPTSGNTGIGLALVAKEYCLKLIIIMPANMSVERIKIIKSYGAEVVLTDAELGMKGAIAEADRLKKKFAKAIILSQFDNPSNYMAHYRSTAPEIVRDLPEVSWVISPVGTGGTITGIKKYFIDNNIKAKVCAVEPYNSSVLSGGQAGAHAIPGIGAGFIPSIIDMSIIDKIITITDDEAKSYARLLAKKHGIMGGYSSGAAFAASIKLAQEEDGNIVFIVPDTGMRYLSMDLFDE